MDYLDRTSWLATCFVIALLIWLALAGFLDSYGSFGQKESVDFIWQLIGFSFILATLIFAISSHSLSQRHKRVLSFVGFAFILSAVVMLLGLSISMYGVVKKFTVVTSIGSGIYIFAVAGISCGLAAMAMVSAEKMLSTFRKEK